MAEDAATLPTYFPLDDWAAAFRAVEDRTVVKAVIDPTGARALPEPRLSPVPEPGAGNLGAARCRDWAEPAA